MARYGTLDHLDIHTFRQEIQTARECEKADPGYLRGVAESYGALEQFEKWEHEH